MEIHEVILSTRALRPRCRETATGSCRFPARHSPSRAALLQLPRRSPMAPTPGNDASRRRTATRGRRRPAQRQYAPAPAAAVVLTPEGHRRLVARAAWLATERIPRLAHNLDDPDQDGWAGGEYGRAVTELARLTSILEQAMTTEE